MRYGKRWKITFSLANRKEGDSGYLNAKKWHMAHSNTAKSENLENDLTEIVAKVQELVWKAGERLSRCWVEKEGEQVITV